LTLANLKLQEGDRATLVHFLESWDIHQGPVLFAGAGLSRAGATRIASAPPDTRIEDWAGFMDRIRRRLVLDLSPEAMKRLPTDPLVLAQLFEAQYSRRSLIDEWERAIPLKLVKPGNLYDRIVRFPWRAIVTTNYDDLLERAFSRRPVRKIVSDPDLTARASPDEIQIIKMHGDLATPASMVITEEDYRAYDVGRPGIALKVKQLLTEHPLLFVGFSLTDPNFRRIDGWIRDTVGSVRLPAIALAWREPLAAERKMWRDRGVNLVFCAHELERIFEALEGERTSRRSPEDDDLHVRVQEIIRRRTAGWEKELADILVPRMQEPNSTADRLLCGEVDSICRGFGSGLADADRWTFIEALSTDQRRKFLIFAVRCGIYTIILARRPSDFPQDILGQRAEVPGHASVVIDIAERVEKEFGPALGQDERAHVLLARARQQEAAGQTGAAKKFFQEARDAASSKSLQESIGVELREVQFYSADSGGLRDTLKRASPPEDAFAFCRRGADHLLMGDVSAAEHWYRQALEQAQSGDEKYSSLLGLLGCVEEQVFQPSSDRAKDLRSKIRAIDIVECPHRQAVESRLRQACREAINGTREEAVREIREAIREARELGWPHSMQSNVSFFIESAAMTAINVLILPRSPGMDLKADDVQQALTIMLQYGVGTPIGQIRRPDLLRSLGTQEGATWFRERLAAAKESGFPRTKHAQRLIASEGLALLDDSEIIRHVDECVLKPTRAFWQGTLVESWSVLYEQWRLIGQNREHLPQNVVIGVLDVIASSVVDEKKCMLVEPRSLASREWHDAGFTTAAQESVRSVAAALARALDITSLFEDRAWLRNVVGLIEELSDWKAIDATVSQAMGVSLTRAISHTKDDENDALVEMGIAAACISAETECLRIAAQMLPASYQRNQRSSYLGRWCWAVSAFGNHFDPANDALRKCVDDCVARMRETGIRRSLLRGDWVARMLVKLALSEEARRSAANAVLDFAKQDALALPELLDFSRFDDCASLLRDAETMLLDQCRAGRQGPSRFQALMALEQWCEADRRPPGTKRIAQILRLLDGDEASTRALALRSAGHLSHAEASVRKELLDAALAGAEDASWVVRAEAARASGKLANGTDKAGQVRELLDKMIRTEPIALVRRRAEIGLRALHV
jgi:hypothetical protein